MDAVCLLKSELGRWGGERWEIRMLLGKRKKDGWERKLLVFHPSSWSEVQWRALEEKKEARDAWVVVSLWNEECFSCCCRGFILENASPPLSLSAAFTGMCPWLTASSLAYIKISKKKTRATYIQPEISRHILATSRWPLCARIFRTRKKKN